MRDIKFRGKPTDNNATYFGNEEFVYGSLVIDNSKYYIVLGINDNIDRDDYEVYMVEVIPETIGQYTGLKDKNGKEIYEGDILKFSEVDTTVVEWNEEYSYFMVKPIQDYYFDSNVLGHALEYNDNVEIIGNIYAESKLLESEE